LGDVFEALIGAVFIDSAGLEQVLVSFQHILCPFLLFTAKYSKQLNHEPKEDFIIQS
jgi:dsRNA-specific ribonuclease